ncbi:phosphoenolpyruvate synthase regulatory protein [Sandarakinorhabdus cyanobacteriorum]|uniref:Putative pyruvate, phosphate dikinase regulatory protein n=1 Tax=Sandarakinorhabdus cyanobacteriorum TaxID=1981098 RepID=A0A255YBY6_9SPHN|nr:pyruvate, water dikinase regulatory protein [Sandarakinorhabdus cyanobacteriorum]OYQ26739.1 phosphoenolpyruvate synthase regulatory protein [Sandarakinorhabdus cyanobacteriorum]
MTSGETLHLHLISDSTGETLESVAKASLARFEGAEAVKHFWPMVRSEGHLDRIITEVAKKPGLVIYTLVDGAVRDRLEQRCATLGLPMVSPLDPTISALSELLGQAATRRPGRQHVMDEAYFRRVDAINYTMVHDDGAQAGVEDLEEADIVLLGVSRTSKTPTSIYLANRGYKTANIPLVPQSPPPAHVWQIRGPLLVGLTTATDRLVQIRRNRLLTLGQTPDTDYVDAERIDAELAFARRLFADHDIPVIDVSRRSIEETAAAIINLHQARIERAS